MSKRRGQDFDSPHTMPFKPPHPCTSLSLVGSLGLPLPFPRSIPGKRSGPGNRPPPRVARPGLMFPEVTRSGCNHSTVQYCGYFALCTVLYSTAQPRCRGAGRSMYASGEPCYSGVTLSCCFPCCCILAAPVLRLCDPCRSPERWERGSWGSWLTLCKNRKMRFCKETHTQAHAHREKRCRDGPHGPEQKRHTVSARVGGERPRGACRGLKGSFKSSTSLQRDREMLPKS